MAHEEIALCNPKGNEKNAGFTPQEQRGFRKLLQAVSLTMSVSGTSTPTWPTPVPLGPIRQIRDPKALVGALIIFSYLSLPTLCNSKIHSKALGSDHCPNTLYLVL